MRRHGPLLFIMLQIQEFVSYLEGLQYSILRGMLYVNSVTLVVFGVVLNYSLPICLGFYFSQFFSPWILLSIFDIL